MNGTARTTKSCSNATSTEDLAACLKDLEMLPELIKEKFTTWEDGTHSFQLECMRAQMLQQDILLHAATGLGRTGIAAGPHLLPSSKGKVTMFVSPLLSLHDEQVTTFKEEFGLTAVRVNSFNGGCSRTLVMLEFDPNNYIFVNMGNDCPNIAQVVHAMEHPMNSFHDINFVIPDSMNSPTNIPKTFVYADDITVGGQLTNHLNGRVNVKFHHLGLGCDIRDIDIVVQWKAPTSTSSWVQLSGHYGLAVLLVEKAAFETNSIAIAPEKPAVNMCGRCGQGRGGVRGRGGSRGGKRGTSYTILHGQKCGTHTGAHDAVTIQDEPPLSDETPVEGLFVFMLEKIFKNTPFNFLSTRCCDLCDPSLSDCVQPGLSPAAQHQTAIKKGIAIDSVHDALYAWRCTIKYQHYSKVPTWHCWEQHSNELFKLIQDLNIPSLVLVNSTSKKWAATASSSQPLFSYPCTLQSCHHHLLLHSFHRSQQSSSNPHPYSMSAPHAPAMHFLPTLHFQMGLYS
ncbi:hypothetical protein PILCRDRAFT_98805 [Piloderma croceum F 1598]|uniref:DEAD/DEAH-box helicase domain-containing protein n=1 Tax=Piloderma croceum (strain F 1598) TaxID=765440 RepID=A0A0C3F7R0_PILCF|nr:hypothetical protein PILCRDRAFT_98805 [Piloderma croceum F 1598]